MPIMERGLDQIEQQLLNKPTAVLVRYRGVLDEAALRWAYEVLSRRHPLLRGAVSRGEAGWVFRAAPSDQARVVVREGDDTSYLRELAKSWDYTASLAQLTVCRGAGNGVVAMTTDHAMADGPAKFGLMTQLWDLYAAKVRGATPVTSGGLLPASPARLLADYLGRPEPALPDAGKPPESHVLGQKHVSLSEEDTARLVQTARDMGTSVHSLLAGVVMLVQRAHLGAEEAVSMACRSTVDLRPRMRPPLAPTDVTSFAGLQVAQVYVRHSDDPVTIGKEIKEQLETGITRNEPAHDLASRVPGEPEAFGGAGLHIATVTNLGVSAGFGEVPGLDLEDFQMFSYTGSFSHPTYVAHTYRGRLNFQVAYRPDTFDAAEIDDIAGALLERLRWFSGS